MNTERAWIRVLQCADGPATTEGAGGARKRRLKQRRILAAFTGLSIGFLVALAYRLTGYWTFSLGDWAWLIAATAVVHGVFWLVLQLRWDRHLHWDPTFLYLPWATTVLLLCLSIYLLPEARVFMLLAHLINLLFLVGLVGLVVEDEEAVRLLAERILETQGYRVLVAGSPAEALSLAAAEQIDLLVTDIVMPEMDGVELAQRITTANPNVKVLLVSGYAERTIVEKKLADPRTPFLGKPFGVGELLNKVREVLDSDGRGGPAPPILG